MTLHDALQHLRKLFGSALQEHVSLANYTTARAGGPVDALLPVNSAVELEHAAAHLWEIGMPFVVLGSGSNVLVSDAGLPGVVLLNRARAVKFDIPLTPGPSPTRGEGVREEPGLSVWAESGANLGAIARQAALRGLSGLEWAAAIPGSLGGAIYGNAGAYGSDMSQTLEMADILHPHGREAWTAERMAYTYRSSALKRARPDPNAPSAVILSARLRLSRSDSPTVQAQMERNAQRRRAAQPPGASMGSMFKNPPGDYAGRLIEAAGLKAARFGDAEISSVHANFFINHGHASAADIGRLIALAQQTVFDKFGVTLELEIELLGPTPSASSSFSSSPLPMGEGPGVRGSSSPLHVVVLFGGRSGEHEVSMLSSRSILSVLDPHHYQVIPVGISHEGIWYAGERGVPPLQVWETFNQGRGAGMTRVTILPYPDPSGRHWLYALREAGTSITLEALTPVDVVFPVMHGTYGEDGALQGLLEMTGLPYVGAGVLGSAVGMDKGVFKDVMRAHHLPVVDWITVSRRQIERDIHEVIAQAEALGPYPLFTKPANLGSSVGITKCRSRSDLYEGLMEAASYDLRILIERGIPNAREIEISVLGNDEILSSAPGEIRPSGDFYTYEAKYLDERSELVIPAILPPETAQQARALAIQAFRAIDGCGMGRVDFLIDPTSSSMASGEIFISEINTIPGFTAISMYPKLWEAEGLAYGALVDRLIQLALERKHDKDGLERRFRRSR